MRHTALPLMLWAALSLPAQQAPSSVKSIYIGSIGGESGAVSEAEVEQFRTALGRELSKAGFVTVPNAEDADATLTGNVTVVVYHGQGDHAVKDYWVYVTLHSKNEGGKAIWEGSSNPGAKFFGGGHNDSLDKRAQDLAKQLKKRVGSAAKK